MGRVVRSDPRRAAGRSSGNTSHRSSSDSIHWCVRTSPMPTRSRGRRASAGRDARPTVTRSATGRVPVVPGWWPRIRGRTTSVGRRPVRSRSTRSSSETSQRWAANSSSSGSIPGPVGSHVVEVTRSGREPASGSRSWQSVTSASVGDASNRCRTVVAAVGNARPTRGVGRRVRVSVNATGRSTLRSARSPRRAPSPWPATGTVTGWCSVAVRPPSPVDLAAIRTRAGNGSMSARSVVIGRLYR